MVVYDVQDLVKAYPGQSEPANRGITQQIRQGEIFGLDLAVLAGATVGGFWTVTRFLGWRKN